MRILLTSLFLILNLFQFYSAKSTRPLSDQAGNNFSDCTCKCCSNQVKQESVACGVDVILLINAAACVKDYIEGMKITAKRIVEDIEARQYLIGDNGLKLIGKNARVGIITYSSLTHEVHNLNEPATTSELKVWGR